MVGPTQAGFDIAQHSVDPAELRQFIGLTPTNDGGNMEAAGAEAPFRPCNNRLEGEAGDWRQLDSAGVSLVVHRDRHHERHLVFRSTSCLTSSAFAAEVGVVHLHCTRQPVRIFALVHGLHQLVVDQPGRGVARCRFKARADRPVLAWLTK